MTFRPEVLNVWLGGQSEATKVALLTAGVKGVLLHSWNRNTDSESVMCSMTNSMWGGWSYTLHR